MKNNYAIQCNNCGKYSGHKIERMPFHIFHCPYCNKRRTLKKKSSFGLALRTSGPYTTQEISKAVAILNTPESKRENAVPR